MFKQPPFLQKNIAFPFKTKQFHWLKLEGKARMVRRVKPRHSEDVGKPEILTAFSKGSKILAHEQNVWKKKKWKKDESEVSLLTLSVYIQTILILTLSFECDPAI